MSMCTEELKWIMKERPIFNVDTGQTEILQFLRMNHIDGYNTTMGNVDVADQLRGNYRIDRWIRNYKWWWSIFFWDIGVLLTNAYVTYCTICEDNGVPPSGRISHLEFRKHIAMYWINPAEYEREHMSTNTPLSGRKRGRYADDMSPLTMNSSFGSVSSRTTTSSLGKCTRFSDQALKAGKFNCRLDIGLDHIPNDQKGKSARCTMHRWLGSETEKNIVHCPSCNINLCIGCYRPFHTVQDLLEKKGNLRRSITRINSKTP